MRCYGWCWFESLRHKSQKAACPHGPRFLWYGRASEHCAAEVPSLNSGPACQCADVCLDTFHCKICIQGEGGPASLAGCGLHYGRFVFLGLVMQIGSAQSILKNDILDVNV